MGKTIILLICLLSLNLLLGQNKSDGKLYISLDDTDYLTKKSKLGGAHFLYIFQRSEILKKVNLDSLLTSSSKINNRCSFILSPATYLILIEGYLGYPIVFSDVVIRRKRSHFININIKELKKVHVLRPKILMLDYQEHFNKDVEKYNSRFKCK